MIIEKFTANKSKLIESRKTLFSQYREVREGNVWELILNQTLIGLKLVANN